MRNSIYVEQDRPALKIYLLEISKNIYQELAMFPFLPAAGFKPTIAGLSECITITIVKNQYALKQNLFLELLLFYCYE